MYKLDGFMVQGGRGWSLHTQPELKGVLTKNENRVPATRKSHIIKYILSDK